jgi:hypothetical protein
MENEMTLPELFDTPPEKKPKIVISPGRRGKLKLNTKIPAAVKKRLYAIVQFEELSLTQAVEGVINAYYEVRVRRSFEKNRLFPKHC